MVMKYWWDTWTTISSNIFILLLTTTPWPFIIESLFLICDVQVCELGVMNMPCSSTALCRLGLAQLAHCDSAFRSEIDQAALANACLSFQASIMCEGLPLTGGPPDQLISKRALQDYINIYCILTVLYEWVIFILHRAEVVAGAFG